MAIWHTIASLSIAAMLALSGCGSSDTSNSDAGDSDDDGGAAAVAQLGDGSEFYQYVPKKTRQTESGRTEVKPAFVAKQKFTYPANTNAPEVIADANFYSDKSFVFDGEFQEYRSDGKTLHAVGSFKDDHRHGKWIYYHPNGKVSKEVNYVDGQLDGSWTHFDENGFKALDVAYKAGKPHGTWANYAAPDKDGKQAVVRTQQFVDGKLHGPTILYHANGSKRFEQNFQDGLLQGKQTAWYEGGAKAYEVDYDKGVKNGMEIVWDDKGNVVKQREFRNGKPLFTPTDGPTTTASATKQ